MSNDVTAMDKILEVLVLTPTDDGMGAPAMFWGPPGAAKTKILRRFCERVGLPLQLLSPGLMGDGAFGVTPVPIGAGHDMRIHYPSPSWIDMFEDAGDVGMVFIDEITTAPPALQPPLLGLIQERRVGNHYLGEKVRVLGAGNPPAQAAGGWDLSLPVANRMGHFDWPTPPQANWADYMMAKGTPRALGSKGSSAKPSISIADLEKQVEAGWAGAYAKAVGLVTAFTARRQELYYKMPGDGDPQGSRAWPSLRTWDLATNVMTTASILGADEIVTDSLVAGFVGSAAATEFVAFRANADLPDPEALLDGREQWKHDKTRLDRTMAVLSSCAALLSPESKDQALRETRAGTLWGMIAQCLGDATDCAVPAARTLSKAKLANVKAASPVLIKLRPVMEAAGIKPGQ
jgi:hypothetical protein